MTAMLIAADCCRVNMLHEIVETLSLLILLASELGISICDMHVELQQAERLSVHEVHPEHLAFMCLKAQKPCAS